MGTREGWSGGYQFQREREWRFSILVDDTRELHVIIIIINIIIIIIIHPSLFPVRHGLKQGLVLSERNSTTNKTYPPPPSSFTTTVPPTGHPRRLLLHAYPSPPSPIDFYYDGATDCAPTTATAYCRHRQMQSRSCLTKLSGESLRTRLPTPPPPPNCRILSRRSHRVRTHLPLLSPIAYIATPREV